MSLHPGENPSAVKPQPLFFPLWFFAQIKHKRYIMLISELWRCFVLPSDRTRLALSPFPVFILELYLRSSGKKIVYYQNCETQNTHQLFTNRSCMKELKFDLHYLSVGLNCCDMRLWSTVRQQDWNTESVSGSTYMMRYCMKRSTERTSVCEDFELQYERG